MLSDHRERILEYGDKARFAFAAGFVKSGVSRQDFHKGFGEDDVVDIKACLEKRRYVGGFKTGDSASDGSDQKP